MVFLWQLSSAAYERIMATPHAVCIELSEANRAGLLGCTRRGETARQTKRIYRGPVPSRTMAARTFDTCPAPAISACSASPAKTAAAIRR